MLPKAQQRQLLPSPQPTPTSSHILVSILFCQVAGGFGGLLLTLGFDVLVFLKKDCPFQHLQGWSISGALLHAVDLPTPAFLLPHGYFSQELLSLFLLAASLASS